jgi:hypothetical protein
MKRIALAAALLACTTLPLAQMYMPPAAPQAPPEAPKQRATDSAPAAPKPLPQVTVAKYNCEPKPAFPGGAAMRAMDNKRKQFERDMENYKQCMTSYIDERKAFHEANLAMHKAAIEEYTTTMKTVNEALQANR